MGCTAKIAKIILTFECDDGETIYTFHLYNLPREQMALCFKCMKYVLRSQRIKFWTKHLQYPSVPRGLINSPALTSLSQTLTILLQVPNGLCSISKQYYQQLRCQGIGLHDWVQFLCMYEAGRTLYYHCFLGQETLFSSPQPQSC